MNGSVQPFAMKKTLVVLLGVAVVFSVGGWKLWSLSSENSASVITPQPEVVPVAMAEKPPEIIPATVKSIGVGEPLPAVKPHSAAYVVTSFQPAVVPDSPKKETPKGKDHTRPNELLTLMARQLHSEAYQQFIRANGNGRNREIPLMRIKESPWKSPEWSSEELAKEPPPFTGERDLGSIHRLSLNRFADSNAKADAQRLAADKLMLHAKKDHFWQIKSLDLVGVVMHETPVVYISEKVPEMKDLKNKTTRAMDLFETEGIEELFTGKPLYIRSKEGTTRVLGPIHAGKACLKCHHDSKEGDLLGAFSYTLRVAQIEGFGKGGRPYGPYNGGIQPAQQLQQLQEQLLPLVEPQEDSKK